MDCHLDAAFGSDRNDGAQEVTQILPQLFFANLGIFRQQILQFLGMNDEEIANLSEEEVALYSDSVKLALEETAREAATQSPEFLEAVQKRANEQIRSAQGGESNT